MCCKIHRYIDFTIQAVLLSRTTSRWFPINLCSTRTTLQHGRTRHRIWTDKTITSITDTSERKNLGSHRDTERREYTGNTLFSLSAALTVVAVTKMRRILTYCGSASSKDTYSNRPGNDANREPIISGEVSVADQSYSTQSVYKLYHNSWEAASLTDFVRSVAATSNIHYLRTITTDEHPPGNLRQPPINSWNK